MTRTTLSMAKSSVTCRIAEDWNISPSEARFLSILNESTERLLRRGKFWGTYGRYRIRVSSQIMTLPPEIDTVEAIAVGKMPLPLRDVGHMFLENGWGIRDDDYPQGTGISEAIHLGNFPTLLDISTAGIVTVKCDLLSDVGKPVLLLGLDTNGNIIRTVQNGIMANGELVYMTQGGGTASTNSFSVITDIQAPQNLDGQWWLYLGTTTGTLLGNYQWFDIAPSWKRYLIPFINTTVSSVDIMGKKAFFPVKNDADYLIIGNLAAVKLGGMAVLAEGNHAWAEANLLWNGGKGSDGVTRIGAIQELEFELQHHIGDGRKVGITVVGSNIGANQPVEALM